MTSETSPQEGRESVGEWLFSENPSIFMGLARDFFLQRGLGFHRRAEVPSYEVVSIASWGRDIEGVDEQARLTTRGDSGIVRALVIAVLRGQKTSVVRIVQERGDWSIFEPHWSDFIMLLTDHGWQLQDLTEADDAQATNLRERPLSLQRKAPGRPPDPENDEAFQIILRGKSTDEAYQRAFDYWCKARGIERPDRYDRGSFKKAMSRAEERYKRVPK